MPVDRRDDNIKENFEGYWLWWFERDLSCWKQGNIAGSCEHGNELCFSVKSGHFLTNRATVSELIFSEKLVSISTERVWCTAVQCLPRTGKVYSPNFQKWPDVMMRKFWSVSTHNRLVPRDRLQPLPCNVACTRYLRSFHIALDATLRVNKCRYMQRYYTTSGMA